MKARRRDELRCLRGTLYAHVFENLRVGVRRQLLWSLFLDCTALRHEGQTWERAVLVDNLSWNVRRWGEIDGLRLKPGLGGPLLASSFYLAEHYDLRLKRLELKRTAPARFSVEIDGAYDLVGWGELDGEDIPVRLTAKGIPFEGLIVVPDNLKPKPVGARAAAQVASEFLEIADFETPTWDDDFRWLFKPRKDASRR